MQGANKYSPCVCTNKLTVPRDDLRFVGLSSPYDAGNPMNLRILAEIKTRKTDCSCCLFLGCIPATPAEEYARKQTECV